MKEQKKPDLRTQKTYDALMDAMRELLVEKDFDKVTVRELCGRARTRTATFYNHFSDKYDFVAFMVRQEHVRKFEFDDGKDPVGIGDYLNELVRSAYNYLDDNSDLLMSLRRNDFLLGLVYTASEDFMAKIKGQIVTYWKASGSEPSVDPDIATEADWRARWRCYGRNGSVLILPKLSERIHCHLVI